MPRYYFDIHDGELQQDKEGFECDDVEAARDRVLASLAGVAELIISHDDDNHAVTMTVRDEAGSEVYTGTLTFAGSRRDG